MTRTWALLGAAGCALALTTSACGGSTPEPNYSSVTPTPSTTTSTSPTESNSPTGIPTTGPNVSPGETPPTAAAAATQHSQAGALAFAAYYYRLSDWAFATSNFGMLDPLFSTACSACASAQSNLKALVEDGSYFTGGRITTNDLRVIESDGRNGSEYAVVGTFSVAAADLRDPSGTVIRTEAADPDFTLTDWVTWSNGSWLIVEEAKS